MFDLFNMPFTDTDANGKEWLCVGTISTLNKDVSYRLAVEPDAELPAPVVLMSFPRKHNTTDTSTNKEEDTPT